MPTAPQNAQSLSRGIPRDWSCLSRYGKRPKSDSILLNFSRTTRLRPVIMMRLEHGYKMWGRELTPDTNLFECGLGALVDFSKEGRMKY
ncbi:hypothetical protein OSTOST_21284 [Ostertagia ostertagi]